MAARSSQIGHEEGTTQRGADAQRRAKGGTRTERSAESGGDKRARTESGAEVTRTRRRTR